MCHVAAAAPNLTYDCDTHYPWSTKDIVTDGRPTFRDGTLQVPAGPIAVGATSPQGDTR